MGEGILTRRAANGLRVRLGGVAAGLAAALAVGGLATVVSASGAAAGTRPSAAVFPEAGVRYAPSGSSITVRGVPEADLSGMTVTGSVTGSHAGRITALIGARGGVFTPARPFAPGETVTVVTPGFRAVGERGDSYRFRVAPYVAPATAEKALAVAAATSQTATAPSPGATGTSASARAGYVPPACPLVKYRSEPHLHAQRVCENIGVQTSGTPANNYLFMTPGGYEAAGEGIFATNGDLVWWATQKDAADHNLTPVQYDGQPYLALWTGAHAGAHGRGQINLYNSHYQLAGVIQAAGGYPVDSVDLHEIRITPQGNALIGIYVPEPYSTPQWSGTVLAYVVQEVSLLKTSRGIQTGSLLFEWNSLDEVNPSQSMIGPPASGGTWDYFHGNAIDEDTNGNIIVSARNTWGIYSIDPSGGMVWQVGAKGDPRLTEPWCYQHDISALGNNTYSLYDDGGAGPGCAPNSTQHPARGLIFTVDPSTTPVTLTLQSSYTHNPPIYSAYTGSTQLLSNGDVVIDWANTPEITEYNSSGSQVKMDLSLSNWSYRGFSSPWVGLPLWPPSIAAQETSSGTNIWASWNGSTQVQSWQVLGGPAAGRLHNVGGAVQKTGFETQITLKGAYRAVAVEALSASGAVLSTSKTVPATGYAVATSGGNLFNYGNAGWYGSEVGTALPAPVTGTAYTPDGLGYWIVTARGNVFNHGDARWYGSPADGPISGSVVGIAPTTDGNGYWLATSTGSVYAYGDAAAGLQPSGFRPAASVVGITASGSGHGYWLETSAGNVYNFGGAGWYGSRASAANPAPIVGMAALPDGQGYWLVTSAGNVYNFNATWHGSEAGSALPAPISGIAATPDGEGYWLVTRDAVVYAHGDATFYGPPNPSQVPPRTVAIATS